MKNKSALPEKIKMSRKQYPCPRFPGNPSGNSLIACLYQECRHRGSDLKEMAKELDVTYGYLNQLRTGIRSAERISRKMAESCARYLSIPIVSVKLAAGQIKISDFDYFPGTEEAAVERLIIKISSDPDFGKKLPKNMHSLSVDEKKSIALMYIETSKHDVLGLKTLPVIAQSMRNAAIMHKKQVSDKLDF